MCVLAAFVSSCAYIKSVPENATAFAKGLQCHMTKNEVRELANANGIDSFDCASVSPEVTESRCDAAEGRAQYLLLFDRNEGLISVQPGYVYDLTHLTYDEGSNLCKE